MNLALVRTRLFRTLGLQRRIMLYVAFGLAAMFGVVAYLGLGAINQASDLVFRERLATAHTTASILERDFERIRVETREEIEELAQQLQLQPDAPSDTAIAVFNHFSSRSVSPFFTVSGVWVLDPMGLVVATAGSPTAVRGSRPDTSGAPDGTTLADLIVIPALGPVQGATPLAAVVVRPVAPSGAVLLIHLVGSNSTAAYVPAEHGQSPAGANLRAGQPSASDKYHLEVMDSAGAVVLGIGEDERPGESSPHFAAIRDLMQTHGAAALLHKPGAADSFEPHVMAVVPVASTPFYLVLEQPVDVALALPLLLRERLFALIAAGFFVTLAVAWFTTRRVVKPTEQLTAAARRIAEGDLASPIGVTAGDEIGELARSLDVMREHLLVARATADATNRELELRVAERTVRLRSVLRKTISTQEEERHRLALELHDETAQTLAALSIMLDRARDSFHDPSSPAAAHVGEAKVVAARLLDETRRLILGLRPSVLDDLGLVPAVRWQCETTLGDRGHVVAIHDYLGSTRMPGYAEVALFRIVQEAVTNIARHAEARNVEITFTRDPDSVIVVVHDDGEGFDVKVATSLDGRFGSVGLSGMEERVALLNGSFDVQSVPGFGTTITVQVPSGEVEE